MPRVLNRKKKKSLIKKKKLKFHIKKNVLELLIIKKNV